MIIPLRVGSLETNCYFLVEEKSRLGIIVDPGDETDYLTGKIADLNIIPRMILLTHGHFDHVLAASALEVVFRISVFVDLRDNFLLHRMRETAVHFLGYDVPDQPPLKPEDIFLADFRSAGQPDLVVIETPGHTPGGISLYLPHESACITGDLIFADGAVGRTDHSYGNAKDLKKSIQTILKLPGKTRLLPGHGPATTVSEARSFFGEIGF